ncbi:MAG: hypothetical protein E5V75_04995 [Mesorhizobium sp.]|nr:MAG: hypothetical protein E5V75_04995 [Mesorhizobium sp.]
MTGEPSGADNGRVPDWIGSLPAQWEAKSVRRLTLDHRQGYYATDEYTDEGIKLLRITDLRDGGLIEHSQSPFVQDVAEINPFILQQNDFVFARTGGAGTFGLVREAPNDKVAYASYLIRFRFSEEANFLRYAFLSPGFQSELQRNIHGGVNQNVHAEDIKAQYVPIPPKSEQRSIAAFLDRETGKIDALVEEQERLIGLLKEKRQAAVSHAVTKGLDPDAKMKPSGVEWLGDVPEYWEVQRLGVLFREIAEPGSDDLPILSVSIHHGVSDTELGDEDLDRKVIRSDDRSKYKRVRPDDLVYNMMRAWQGGFGSVTADGMVSPAYVVARPKTDVSTRFIEALLRTPQAVEEMRRRSRGVTDFRLRLYWEEFKDISVAVPPVQEQRQIVDTVSFLEIRTAELVSSSQRLVELLQERRAALISAAVTGKIDVQETAQADVEVA